MGITEGDTRNLDDSSLDRCIRIMLQLPLCHLVLQGRARNASSAHPCTIRVFASARGRLHAFKTSFMAESHGGP